MASSSSSSSTALNLKNILYDYAIPGAVAISVGLFTYALTGGELEYTKPQEQNLQQEGADRGFHLDNDGDDDLPPPPRFPALESNEDLLESVMSQIEQQLALYADKTSEQVVTRLKDHVEQSEPPVWAKEILQKAISIEQEVILLRKQLQNGEVVSSSSASTSSTSASQGPAESKSTPEEVNSPSTVVLSLSDYQHNLQLAMFCFVMEVSDADSVSTTTLTKDMVDEAIRKCTTTTMSVEGEEEILRKKCIAACDMMLLFLKNLTTQPEIPRYRRIATSNAGYKSTLGNAVGISRLFIALGFVLKGAYWEWVWYPEPASTSLAVSSGTKESIACKEDAVIIVKHGMELLTLLKKGKIDVLQSLANTFLETKASTESKELSTTTEEIQPKALLADSTISLFKPELNTSNSHTGIVGILKREEVEHPQQEVKIETPYIPSTPPRRVEESSVVSEKPISPVKQSNNVREEASTTIRVPPINKINIAYEQSSLALKKQPSSNPSPVSPKSNSTSSSSAPSTPSKNKSLIAQFENLSKNNRNSETPLRGGRGDTLRKDSNMDGESTEQPAVSSKKDIIAKFENLSKTPTKSQVDRSLTSPNRLKIDEKFKNMQRSFSVSIDKVNNNTETQVEPEVKVETAAIPDSIPESNPDINADTIVASDTI